MFRTRLCRVETPTRSPLSASFALGYARHVAATPVASSVKPLIARLHKVFSGARLAFSFPLFLIILLISLAIFGAIGIDSSLRKFIPAGWKTALTSIGFALIAFLFLIPLINRLMFWLERWMLRLYLAELDPDEKAVLHRFLTEDRTIDVPLDYPSDCVSRLLNIGLLAPGSGIFYPKSEMNPKPYSYFSIPAWVFQTLKQDPRMLNNRDPR